MAPPPRARAGGGALPRLAAWLKSVFWAAFMALYAVYNRLMRSRVKILRPLREQATAGSNDVLLVILPGALTAPAAYLQLAQLVQATSKLRLWVAILNFAKDFPTGFEAEQRYLAVLEKLKLVGYRTGGSPIADVFFAGHSWGGWVGRAVARKHATAFLQMGCWIKPGDDSLPQHPKPVLTLNGEYDGQCHMGLTARHAGEVADSEAHLGPANTVKVKPVVLVKGINHAQFSHGKPNLKRGDFDAVVPLDEAQQRIAEFMSAFLDVHATSDSLSQKDRDRQAAAAEILKKGVEDTQELARPFWEALKSPADGITDMQLRVVEASMPEEEGRRLRKLLGEERCITVMMHDYKDNFIFSKPIIDHDTRKIYVEALLHPQGKYGLTHTLWLKMKSAEAIAEAFAFGLDHEKAVVGGKHMLSVGRTINERAFAKALGSIAEHSRRRYLATGKQLAFAEDKLLAPMDWIQSDVLFEPSATDPREVKVRSPLLHTVNNWPDPRFAGMHYLKVLTVEHAMHWILMDSFR